MPRKILELMGTEVTQIACGKLHTLALVPSRGRLYTFGLGAKGNMTVAVPHVNNMVFAS